MPEKFQWLAQCHAEDAQAVCSGGGATNFGSWWWSSGWCSQRRMGWRASSTLWKLLTILTSLPAKEPSKGRPTLPKSSNTRSRLSSAAGHYGRMVDEIQCFPHQLNALLVAVTEQWKRAGCTSVGGSTQLRALLVGATSSLDMVKGVKISVAQQRQTTETWTRFMVHLILSHLRRPKNTRSTGVKLETPGGMHTWPIGRPLGSFRPNEKVALEHKLR